MNDGICKVCHSHGNICLLCWSIGWYDVQIFERAEQEKHMIKVHRFDIKKFAGKNWVTSDWFRLP